MKRNTKGLGIKAELIEKLQLKQFNLFLKRFVAEGFCQRGDKS